LKKYPVEADPIISPMEMSRVTDPGENISRVSDPGEYIEADQKITSVLGPEISNVLPRGIRIVASFIPSRTFQIFRVTDPGRADQINNNMKPRKKEMAGVAKRKARQPPWYSMDNWVPERDENLLLERKKGMIWEKKKRDQSSVKDSKDLVLPPQKNTSTERKKENTGGIVHLG
jgi:hypothetical protein